MPHGEFLRLLQAVEASRKCEGKDCLDITDVHVALASQMDSSRLHHLSADGGHAERTENCEGCENIRQQEIALRETMHSQGVDFPVGVLGGQPEP